jgi:uncharacterized protein (UPF0261 family)
MGGSVVSAGPDRLMGAGRRGVPMIVAPGATDLVDYPAWGQMPERFAGRPSHDHNRLIASVGIDVNMRREFARELASRLRQAQGPVHLVLPLQGIQEWDRAGAPLHDAEGLAGMMDEMSRCDWGFAEISCIDAHINDAAFVQTVLAVFDDWLARGLLMPAVAQKVAHV